jgi:rhodanese-related sulfurtransferase
MTSATTESDSTQAKVVQEISPRTVQEWLSTGQCVLIDVREADEHAREHISGSRLHALSGFDPTRIEDLNGKRLVIHCRSGKRSADAAGRILADRARTGEVYTMSGGLESWKQLGLPVEVNTNVSRISIMRQVQLVVGIGALIGSALAWFVHPAFIAVPAFFGAGLTFAGATGTCAMATMLSWMPWNRHATSMSANA